MRRREDGKGMTHRWMALGIQRQPADYHAHTWVEDGDPNKGGYLSHAHEWGGDTEHEHPMPSTDPLPELGEMDAAQEHMRMLRRGSLSFSWYIPRHEVKRVLGKKREGKERRKANTE